MMQREIMLKLSGNYLTKIGMPHTFISVTARGSVAIINSKKTAALNVAQSWSI